MFWHPPCDDGTGTQNVKVLKGLHIRGEGQVLMCNHPMIPCCEPPKAMLVYLLYPSELNKGAYYTKGWHDMLCQKCCDVTYWNSMTSNTMSANALSPSMGWGQFPSWNWKFIQFKFRNSIEDDISILEYFTMHLKFIPPTAKTSFKPNLELDNGYIPWFFAKYVFTLNPLKPVGAIALKNIVRGNACYTATNHYLNQCWHTVFWNYNET